MKKEVTILTTWDNEIIELEVIFEKWIESKSIAKFKGDDGIFIQNKTRFIKFSNIKDEQAKIKYLLLPEGKKEKKILSPEEQEKARIEKEKFIKLCLEKSEKKRRENFVNDRIKILKNLEIREKYWGMTSTIDKLNQLDTYKKKESLKSL